jgi:arylsulfatase A-like enzyme
MLCTPGCPLFSFCCIRSSALSLAAPLRLSWVSSAAVARGRWPLQATVTLSVIWVFCANAAVRIGSPIASMMYVVLALALTMGIAAAAAIPLLCWLRFLASPWSASFLLVGVTWISARWTGPNRLSGYLWAAGYAAAVALISILAQRFWKTGAMARFAHAGIVTAILICTGVLEQAPLRGAPPAGQPASDKPNVILISLDTVRAGHLSVYGYRRDTTPNLRSFAAEATLFREAVSTGAMTLSSHASLFTGHYALRHGAHAGPEAPGGRPLGDEFPTVAETLAKHGYFTAAVIANTGYLTPFFNFDRGFHHYDFRAPRMLLEGFPRYCLRGSLNDAALSILPDTELSRWTRSAEEINSAVFHLLEKERGRERPFFLFLNYMDAHRPYLSPKPFRDRFPGRNARYGAAEHRRLLEEVMTGKRPISDAERAHLTSQYDGALAYLDHQVGKLFARLKALGLWENSLIIVTSDHGESFGGRNLIEHGSSTYQTQVGVPLLIRYPGPPRGRESGVRASGVDILPTILDVAKIEIPSSLDGHSLLDEDALERRAVFAESYATGVTMELDRRFRHTERAVYFDRWKLVDARTGQRELYDLAQDPRETRNLYLTERPVAEFLAKLLSDWSANSRRHATPPPPLDQKTVERLRSLGYIR